MYQAQLFVVEHVGNLARIEMSDNEKEKFAQNLGEIIDYVAELESAPTENIEIISQVSGLENIMRADIIAPSLPVEKVLQNAPDKQDDYIKVKKVF